MPVRAGAGFTTLLSKTITTAETAAVTIGRALSSNTKSMTVQANFTYGSGGTSFKAWVQVSHDNGTTWTDIANFAGTTSSIRRLYNLTNAAVTSIATPTDGTLADNTCVNGLFGPLIRVKYTTVGTYAGGTTLVINIVPSE